MHRQPLIIARKELLAQCRDRRAMLSSAAYALMGPAVVFIVLVARGGTASASPNKAWAMMAAVFALMAAFTSVAGIAADMIAGEREHRSLLPLLSASSRKAVILGKWVAGCVFGVAGLLVNVLAFAVVFAVFQAVVPSRTAFVIAPALLGLAVLTSSLAILISAGCRSTRESNTWWSMLTFAVMGASMWLAFRPETARGWWSIAPIVGHQRLLEWTFSGGALAPMDSPGAILRSAAVGVTAAAAALVIVGATCALFRRDEAIYGG